jgi:hypothetical protein
MDQFDPCDIFNNLAQVQQPRYRIYYDESGRPISYSVDDLPGNYIEVDASTYMLSDINIRIVNGAIVKITPTVSIAKYRPASTGVCCRPDNVCIVVDHSEPHIKWNWKTHETY